MSSLPASPSPFSFPLPSSSASSSPLGTPRVRRRRVQGPRPSLRWTRVRNRRKRRRKKEDRDRMKRCRFKSEGDGEREQDGETPFLNGIPLSDGEVTRAVRWGEGDASSVAVEENSVENTEANENAGEDSEEAQEGELTASQLSRLEHVLECSALYSTILKQQMDDAPKLKKSKQASAKSKGKQKKAVGRPAKRRKRAVVADSDAENDEEEVQEQDQGQGEQDAVVSGTTTTTTTTTTISDDIEEIRVSVHGTGNLVPTANQLADYQRRGVELDDVCVWDLSRELTKSQAGCGTISTPRVGSGIVLPVDLAPAAESRSTRYPHPHLPGGRKRDAG
ncbi:hypothetical protein B0H14DRAFT_3142973 [Mycena olivaceomarginata]|nr:hypothetical protein B0H14DRAFT_3142973 [Mycena olivaceomarginata]